LIKKNATIINFIIIINVILDELFGFSYVIGLSILELCLSITISYKKNV